MTSRERIVETLSHREPEELAIDFGGMRSTGIHAIGYRRLVEYLKLDLPPARLYDVFQQLAEPQAAVVERLGGDVVQAHQRCPAFGIPIDEGWKEIELSEGVRVLAPAGYSPVPEPDGGAAIYSGGVRFARKPSASLYFDQDRSPAAIDAVRQLPGVLRAEPFRAISVTLRNRQHEKDLTIFGVETDTDLGRIMDVHMRPMAPPDNGIVLIGRVADALGLRIGDAVEVELVERDHRKVTVPVTGISQSLVGIDAHMHIEALNELVGDGRRISGARLALDTAKRDALFSEVKNTPALAFVMLIGLSRERFRATIEENIAMMQVVYTTLAVIVAFGLIYNSARIQLSERARELASLRVLGFTPAEVSRVLLTELATVILAAQPLGWLLGYGFARLVVEGVESDLFRIPFFINASTFAVASLIVLAASLASALVVRRRVDALDLIAVLKSRE